MDVKLQNAYTSVLLDNFMSVVKQNIMFQAQLEVLNESVREAEESKRKLKELSDRNVELQQSIDASSIRRNENVKYDDLLEEKKRLQIASNSYMRQLEKLKRESVDEKMELLKRIEELTKYVVKLESAIPTKKMKLVNAVQSDNSEVERSSTELSTSGYNSGGTF